MELIVRVWVGPDQAVINEGAALLRTFCTDLFEDDKFTNDDFDFLYRPETLTTIFILRTTPGLAGGYEQRTFPICGDYGEENWSESATARVLRAS